MEDLFNEEEAQTKLLSSKPASFVVFGKPGCGKTTLAKGLARQWGCHYIGGQGIILDAINLETELGKQARDILWNGGSIPDSMLIGMLDERLKSPEIACTGYVLDDFPTISQDHLTVADQLEYLKGLTNQPDFLINIRIPDNDLFERRKGFKVDPLTNVVYRRDCYDKEVEDVKQSAGHDNNDEEAGEEEDDGGVEEEEATEEVEGGGEEKFGEHDAPQLTAEVIARLVKRAEDMDENIKHTVHSYKGLFLRKLEDFMGDRDAQRRIELDGNLPPKEQLQELMTRLNAVTLTRAHVPLRLQGGDDQDEVVDDTDTDDMLRSLATSEMMAPGFRWRRSRWGRICPVSLYEGNVAQGAPQFSVSFLDKMYLMATSECMQKFIANPRKYLAAPQPRPPCKLSVLGPPFSGKSTICKAIAEIYSAKVFNVAEMVQPLIDEKRRNYIEEIRKEAMENAIHRTRSLLEQERDRESQSIPETIREDEESEAEGKGTATYQAGGVADAIAEDKEEEHGPEKKVQSPEEDVVVDENHPEVKRAVEEAVAEADVQELTIGVEVYMDTLESAIVDWYTQLQEKNPEGRTAGNWILDNFPETREQLNVMVERGIVPDDIICLKDSSEGNKFLFQRWHQRKTSDSTPAQAGASQGHPVDEGNKAEVGKQDSDPGPDGSGVEAVAKEEDSKQRSTGREASTDEKEGEETDEETQDGGPANGVGEAGNAAKKKATTNNKSSKELGPGAEVFKKQIATYEARYMALQNICRNTYGISPIIVDCSLQADAVVKEVIQQITAPYEYKGWEYTGMDQDEEEEDMEGEEEEEEEDHEEDPLRRNQKKPFGDTRHFCPVQLKDRNVLWPGTQEIAAKYKERVYFFSDLQARTTFLENPEAYLAIQGPLKPPPPRILFLGAKGSGKTTQARQLAKKFGLFHVSFKDLLQEKVLLKLKKRIGPDYPEDDIKKGEEEEDEDEEDEKKNDGISDTNESGKAEKKESSPMVASEIFALGRESRLATVQEGDQEAEPELTEIEENIRDNIMENEPLSLKTMESLLTVFWEQEPFKSVGFILEGFPRIPDEVRFLSDYGFLPDCAVYFEVEDIDIVERLMSPLFTTWKKKRDIRLAKKQKEMRRKQKKREEEKQRRINIKRAEFEDRKAEKLRDKEARRRYEEDEEDEEEEEEAGDEESGDEEAIEAMVEVEMAEEYDIDAEEEEEEESPEDAIDRIRGELTDQFEEDTQILSNVQETLQDVMIPRLDLQAGRKPHIVQHMLQRLLMPIIAHRESLFETCQPVSSALADRLLNQGYKQPSKFGRWCPIKLLEGEILPSFESAQRSIYPVVHRQYVYFLSSEKAREQFSACPWKFIRHEPPLPTVPLRLAIIGPPKSGKTTLANRFVEEYGLVRLSIGEAMRRILLTQDKTDLAQQIQQHLRAGLTVPDELAIQTLEVATLSVQCQTRGFVLDGYPMTEHQMRLLTAKSIIPYITFELRVSDISVMKRGSKDRVSSKRMYPLHDSRNILSTKLIHYQKEVPFVRNWYKDEHRNLCPIDGERSKWWIWNQALNWTKGVVKKIQEYVHRSNQGLASKIFDLCITPKEVNERLGDFGHYCPVSFIDRGELVDGSEHESLEFAAEFRGHYYLMASNKDLQTFLDSPEKYVPPLACRSLPSSDFLPKKCPPDAILGQFPGQLELQGYCPVTYLDGNLRYEALKLGDAPYLVKYREKLYACCSDAQRDKFLRTPEKYSHVLLPRKLPPQKESLPISSLPMIGFLEQSVATAITKAMTAAGCLKPKYPFLTAKQSALLYVAYHLKAYNPKSSEYVRKKYKRKLQQFEERCQLIRYLGGIMTYKYCEPEDRPKDFDHKLLSFMSLKGVPPPAKWLA